jgi:hypothetical protein
MNTIADNVSFFRPPIGNTLPEKTMSLHAVSRLVMLGELEEATNNVRSGIWSKTEKLPYITPSGCFSKRKNSALTSYSGIVSIDLDDVADGTDATDSVNTTPAASAHQHINTSAHQLDSVNTTPAASAHQHINTSAHQLYRVSTFKHLIFADKFLNPAFIFVSPGGKGLKIFIRIRNAEASFHADYFRVLSAYFMEKYGIIADKACKDAARACLLCHDPNALFSLFGCVSHTDLLRKLPPEPPEPPAIVPLLNSAYAHFSYKVDYGRHISDKLNANYYVHEHALNCLRKNGWVQKGIFFTRPGKAKSSAISATFSIPERYSIYIFYNFSSNAQPFQAGKGYTDCGVISLLEYNGDYARCISALLDKYDSQIRA